MLFGESTGEGGHQPLSREHNLLYIGISSRGTTGQYRGGKHSVKIGRDLLQAKVVVRVAMGATNLVQVLPFQLLLSKGGRPMATCRAERRQEDEQKRNEMGLRIHVYEGPQLARMAQIRERNP